MKIKNLFIKIAILTFFSFEVFSQSGKPIYIWRGVEKMQNQKTVMYFHKADSKNEKNAAVIICPGGSYHHLGIYNEGYKSAKWFSKNGIQAFNLRYRTAESDFHYPAMLEDLQRAIQIVRENAKEYNIDPEKIGVIGFSAGGHLVTMAGAFFDSHNELKKLGIESSVSLKPNFVIPVYPVVSMQDEIAHKWSRKSLLGENQTADRKNEFSMEKQITSSMPPTYVVCCKDDNVVDYQNSVELVKALKNAGVPHKFALYDWGKHGFGMLNNRFMKTFHYNEKILEWLISIDFGKINN